MTEHQLHIFGEIILLAVIVFGMLGVLIHLDKKGSKTYSSRQKKSARRECRPEKTLSNTKRHKK